MHPQSKGDRIRVPELGLRMQFTAFGAWQYAAVLQRGRGAQRSTTFRCGNSGGARGAMLGICVRGWFPSSLEIVLDSDGGINLRAKAEGSSGGMFAGADRRASRLKPHKVPGHLEFPAGSRSHLDDDMNNRGLTGAGTARRSRREWGAVAMAIDLIFI